MASLRWPAIVLAASMPATALCQASDSLSAEGPVRVADASPAQIHIAMPDTLRIQGALHGDATSDHMPWLSAFLIGLLSAGANIWLGVKMRRSNEHMINEQIKQARRQSEMEFRGKLNAENRQHWINSLRDSVGELITNAQLLVYAQLANSAGSHRELLERILFCKFKVAMLLNEEKPDQKRLMDLAEVLMQEAIKGERVNVDAIAKATAELVGAARLVFIRHWDKIKNLESTPSPNAPAAGS